MVTYKTVLVSLCCIVQCLNGCQNLKRSDSLERVKDMAITKDKAIENSLNSLGLLADQIGITASQVTLSDQILPCIKSSMTKNAWRITFENVSIKVKDGNRTVTNPYIKSLTVYLSSETGQVMKVVSPPQGDPTVKSFPSPQVQEQQMRCIFQVFVGLPKAAPKVTFMEALQQAEGGVANAKQIIAYYVIEKRTDPRIEERAVWTIHLWGIPPLQLPAPISETPGKEVWVEPINHLRSIIDAETGQWYGSDNIP